MVKNTLLNEPPVLVSVVIVNYDGAQLLHDCLRSVFLQSYRPMEVIVVDNASTDQSVELVRREFPQVRLIANARNLGFAGGNNVGVAAARGEYIVLLNNDTVVDSEWLPPLLQALADERAAVITSKVITEGIPDAFFEMNGTLNYLGYNIMCHFADMSRIFYAGGTSIAFRKGLVNKPFPDEYFLYHEDTYLSWRARLRGLDVRMAPHSLVRHRGSLTSKLQASPVVTFYQERNRLLNCLLFYEPGTLTRLLPYFAFDVLTKTVASLFVSRKSFVGTMKAYGWIAMHTRWIRNERRALQKERKVADTDVLCLMSADLIDPARSHAVFAPLNALSRLYARTVGLPYHEPDTRS